MRYITGAMTSTIISLFMLGFGGKVYAAELLKYQPNCIQEHKENILRTITHIRPISPDIEVREVSMMTKPLDEIVTEATQKGFDSVILTHFLTTQKAIDPFTRKKTGETEYRTTIQATLVNLCKDDRSLSEAPIVLKNNDRNIKIGTYSSNVKITREIKMPFNDRVKPQPTSHDVSIEQAFGISLGTDKQALVAVLGAPDYQFVLTPDTDEILGYGRELFFLLRNNQVVRIQYGNGILSTELANRMHVDSPFDANEWTLNAQPIYDRDIDTLKPIFDGWQRKSKMALVLSKGDNSLILRAVEYHPVGINHPEYRIKGFILAKSAFSGSITYKFDSELDTNSIQDWLAQTRTQSGEIKPPPFDYQKNFIWDQRDKLWFIVNNQVMLNVDDDKIRTIELQPSWLNNGESLDLAPYLKALRLPLTKNDFMKEFTNYFESDDKYESSNDAVDISIQYSSKPSSNAVESAALKFLE